MRLDKFAMEQPHAIVPPDLFKDDSSLAARFGELGQDLLGQFYSIRRALSTQGRVWVAGRLPEGEPGKVDSRPFAVRLAEIHATAFLSDADAGIFEAWARLPEQLPPVLLLQGADEAGLLGMRIACLAAEPGPISSVPVSRRGVLGDCRICLLNEQTDLPELVKLIELAYVGRGWRLILLATTLPEPVKAALRGRGGVRARLSSACMEAGRLAALPQVPRRVCLNSTAELVGRTVASMGIARGRGGVWLKDGNTWRKANATRFRDWLARRISMVDPASRKPVKMGVGDARTILFCQRFLRQIEDFEIHGIESPER